MSQIKGKIKKRNSVAFRPHGLDKYTIRRYTIATFLKSNLYLFDSTFFDIILLISCINVVKELVSIINKET